jgi:hypothetical protein
VERVLNTKDTKEHEGKRFEGKSREQRGRGAEEPQVKQTNGGVFGLTAPRVDAILEHMFS